MLEQYIGHRLKCEKVIWPHLRAQRHLVGPNFFTLLPPVAVKSSVLVSLFTVWSGHLAIFPLALSGPFLAVINLGTVWPRDPRKVAMKLLPKLFWTFLVIPRELL